MLSIRPAWILQIRFHLIRKECIVKDNLRIVDLFITPLGNLIDFQIRDGREIILGIRFDMLLL